LSRDRTQQIEQRLREQFDPLELLVKDQSHLHIGHEGARDGRGHFDVTVISDAFRGMPRLQRHRMIHDALNDLLQTDIHALRIKAHAPGER
jgi:BolA protein